MKRQAFTLVEILIVVIILGILAAIVIPQFTEASNDARTSALASDLQTVRSQIELFKVQHLEVLPGQGTDAMESQLTSKTNVAGAVGTTAAHTFGPYLQKFPTNPYNSLSTVESGTGSAGGGDYGWYYNTTTGDFAPDDDAHSDL